MCAGATGGTTTSIHPLPVFAHSASSASNGGLVKNDNGSKASPYWKWRRRRGSLEKETSDPRSLN